MNVILDFLLIYFRFVCFRRNSHHLRAFFLDESEKFANEPHATIEFAQCADARRPKCANVEAMPHEWNVIQQGMLATEPKSTPTKAQR